MEKRYNYLYKITNKLTGKFYYGIHSTDVLDDNYLCSSKWVKKDVKEFGIENFRREIFAWRKTRAEILALEKEYVGLEQVKDPMCYNLLLGGSYCFPPGESHPIHQIDRTGASNPMFGRKITPEGRSILKQASINLWENRYDEMREKATKNCLIAQKISLLCIRYHNRKHWPREAYEWLKDQLSKPQPKYNGLERQVKELFGLSRACYKALRREILNGDSFEKIIGLDLYQQYLDKYGE